MRRLRVDRDAVVKELHLFMGREEQEAQDEAARQSVSEAHRSGDDDKLAKAMAQSAVERQRGRRRTAR